MEFCEKLQELRKSRALTQEQLAEALYVSRAAVSKWESGRGYPGIDSLKEISRYFGVSIDDLLSGEKLLSIAEKETQSSIQSLCGWLFGFADLFSVLLIVLPLYPNTIDGYVYSVSLFAYVESAPLLRRIYWVLFLSLFTVGIVKVLLTRFSIESARKAITDLSIVLSILIVLFLALTKEAYAVCIAFMLLAVKVFLLFKSIKAQK